MEPCDGYDQQGENALTFALEDTQERCYRDISNALKEWGWKQVGYKKKSKSEKTGMR